MRRAAEYAAEHIEGRGTSKVPGAPRVYESYMRPSCCQDCVGFIDLAGLRDSVIRILLAHSIEISFSGVALDAGELLITTGLNLEGYYQVRVIAENYNADAKSFQGCLLMDAALLEHHGESMMSKQDAITRRIVSLMSTSVALHSFLKVGGSKVPNAPRVYETSMRNLADRCHNCLTLYKTEGIIDLVGVRDIVIRSLLDHAIEIAFSGVALDAGELLITTGSVGKPEGYYQIRVIAENYNANRKSFRGYLEVDAALLERHGEFMIQKQDAITRQIEFLISKSVTFFERR